jgi:predicted lipoprotein
MMKKWLKCIVLVAVTGLLVYNSVYFKKLDAKKEVTTTNLNPTEFAQKFWNEKFASCMDSAVEIGDFVSMLKENPKMVFEKYARTQGIGNTSFFLVKGEGVIKSVNEDEVLVAVKHGTEEIQAKINTGIYFGNAVRDVTGMISMGDFSNTMDYNNVSSELNKIVRMQVVMPFKAKVVKGETVQFVGCIEINNEQINTTGLQILPVSININK